MAKCLPMSENLENSTQAESLEQSDVTDVIVDSLEGDTNATLIDEPKAEEPVDRALIIGADGRWVAGWALRFIIMVVASIIIWKALGTVWAAVLPALLALLVCTILWPPVRWLRDHKFPPALAALTVMLASIGIISGIFTAMAPAVASQSKDLIASAEVGIHQLQEWAQKPPLNLNVDKVDNLVSEVTGFIQNRSSDIASGVFSGVSVASSIMLTFVLTIILTFFFLKDGTRFLPMLRTNVGPNVGWHLTEALTRVWNTLTGFIRAQAIVSLVDAIFIGIGLIVLGVPLAFVLAVITFFAGFIPIVGAFTAGALAVIIALVSNGVKTAIFVFILIILVQQIEGHVLQPLLQSRAMDLHAAIVLLSVTLGSTLFGVVGAFLAVPVAATIAVLVRYHSQLVALRAGEITLDDIEIATADVATPSANPAQTLTRFKESLSKLGKRRTQGEA